MRNWLALPLLLIATPAIPQVTVGPQAEIIPTTNVYAGMPPVRYMGGGKQLTVSFGTLSHCGTPPPGLEFKACVRGDVIHMPNPCESGSREEFARLMCHEMAHTNGWPGSHGP